MSFLTLIGLIAVAAWLKSWINDLDRRLHASDATQAGLLNQLATLQRRLDGQPPSAPPIAAPPQDLAPSQPAAPSDQPAAAEPIQPALPPRQTSSVPPVPVGSPEPVAAPASASATFEEQLGTRWAVWVGALALALGGILLVRYSIENNLIGPGLRITFGALLALALAGAGEHLRRSERRLELPVIPAAHIPSALTSAATIVALGTAFAAHAVYEFIGPAFAFVILGAIALSALAAAALHGPALAGVGLLGAYVVPLLVTSSAPNPWPVIVYLGIVAAAAYGLARLRSWLWLAGGAVLGALLWSGLLLSADGVPASGWPTTAMTHVLIQLALCAYFFGIEPHADRADRDSEPDAIGHIALTALALMAIATVAADPEWPARPLAFALIGIGILATAGYAAASIAGAMLMAGALMIAVLADWPGLKVESNVLQRYLQEFQLSFQLPAGIESFLATAALVSLALSAVAAWRLLRGPELPAATAALYAAAATLPPLTAFVIAYLRVTQFDHSIRFATAGAILAVLAATGAEIFLRAEARQRSQAHAIGTGALAAAAIAALALALTCGLERGYLTVAFAISALGAAFVAVRRDIPLLRYAVVALGAIVLARVLWDPRIMGASVGTVPIFNWLLFGYGVPAACFAIAARLLRSRTDDVSVRLCDGLAVLFAALLVAYEIRHALHGGDPLREASSHVEMGLQATASLGFSYVLARLDLARANVVFRVASLIFGVIAAAVAFIGLGLAENPLLSGEAITGPPWASSLVLGYLLPGAVAVLAARAARGVRPDWFVNMLAALAVLMLLAFVTLEVRHMFQGPIITWLRPTGGAEHWAYSVAWLLLGLAFLAYGVVFSSKPARIASAALVVLAVLKVFLFDMQGLTGLWRALSFITLGLVLIGIGLVYQRLLFQRPQAVERVV